MSYCFRNYGKLNPIHNKNYTFNHYKTVDQSYYFILKSWWFKITQYKRYQTADDIEVMVDEHCFADDTNESFDTVRVPELPLGASFEKLCLQS